MGGKSTNKRINGIFVTQLIGNMVRILQKCEKVTEKSLGRLKKIDKLSDGLL